MRHDSLVYSIPGTAVERRLHMSADSYVAAAKAAVHRELAGTLGFPDAPEEQVRDAVPALDTWNFA